MTTLITYKQYFSDSRNLHRAYHLQFVTPRLIAAINAKIADKQFTLQQFIEDEAQKFAYKKKIEADFYGNILLESPDHYGVNVKPAGEYMTVATAVCIVKEAVRMLASQQN